MTEPEHHSVVIVGGGPGGLGAAAVLEGWRPRLAKDAGIQVQQAELQATINQVQHDLLSVNRQRLMDQGIRPIQFFRSLHHPTQEYQGSKSRIIEFTKGPGLDWTMLTDDEPGGLWNHVPRNQLTLSPGHWMEIAPYRMADFFQETGRGLDPNDLILKDDLVPYYHAAAQKLGLEPRMRKGLHVIGIRREPSNGRFIIETRSTNGGDPKTYTADRVVFGVGPRSRLRCLGIPGEDLPFVSHHYDHWDDYPRQRVVVVGGGRSADWAATELHDAGRQVIYVMRQSEQNHLRLIRESQHLPYYRRIQEIIEEGSRRLERIYERRVKSFEPGGRVRLCNDKSLEADHAVVEIGGDPAYDLLHSFGGLTLRPKRDRYRFQLMQLAVHQESFESVDIPGLYPVGYLAEGTGLSVIGFHAQVYPMAADIFAKGDGGYAREAARDPD